MPMIDELGQFLQLASKLEADAAAGYDQLADLMQQQGREEVAAMFAKFAHFSRLHHQEVEQLRDQEVSTPGELAADPVWPDGHSPENPLALTLAEDMTPRKAVELALETERRACDFYITVAGQSRSSRVRELAHEFGEEEAEHVAHLQRWLTRYD